MKKCQVEDFERVLKKNENCQAVDVREPAEFESERIEGVVSLPLSNLREDRVTAFIKDKPLYLICRSGNRACKAADQLEKFGFLDLYVVEGGLELWAEAGKPVLRGTRRIWSLDRQVRFAAGALVLAGVLLAKLVHPYCVGLSVFVAAGLIFSGITDTCGMAMLLARMPWNKKKSIRI